MENNIEELWDKLNSKAEEVFGEYGFSTLSEDEMKEVLSIVVLKEDPQ